MSSRIAVSNIAIVRLGVDSVSVVQLHNGSIMQRLYSRKLIANRISHCSDLILDYITMSHIPLNCVDYFTYMYTQMSSNIQDIL